MYGTARYGTVRVRVYLRGGAVGSCRVMVLYEYEYVSIIVHPSMQCRFTRLCSGLNGLEMDHYPWLRQADVYMYVIGGGRLHTITVLVHRSTKDSSLRGREISSAQRTTITHASSVTYPTLHIPRYASHATPPNLHRPQDTQSRPGWTPCRGRRSSLDIVRNVAGLDLC